MDLIDAVDELERYWSLTIECALRRLDACGEVIRHLSYGEEGCPVSVYCSSCERKNKCRFFSSLPMEQSEQELHMRALSAWQFLRQLQLIKQLLNKTKLEELGP